MKQLFLFVLLLALFSCGKKEETGCDCEITAIQESFPLKIITSCGDYESDNYARIDGECFYSQGCINYVCD